MPQGAYSKTEWGATIHDPDLCIGCQYCATACPFDIPKYLKRVDKITKCTLCADRVEEGLEPACARTCPTDALQFGNRDELLQYAEDRVKHLRANGFPRATIYGKLELGGLNKLYVLTDTPDKFGLPVDPKFKCYLLAKLCTAICQLADPSVLTGFGHQFCYYQAYRNKNKRTRGREGGRE
jgi:formate dehydrogenase iron-sulfur subunit